MKHRGFQQLSRRDKLLAKRQPFMKYAQKTVFSSKYCKRVAFFGDGIGIQHISVSYKCHKLPQHLSSAIQPPVAPQATHGKRHLCANIGDLILLKAQHLQGLVAAQSLCKRLRKRNLGNSSANMYISMCACVKLNPL